jgi:hypothetical protein
VKNLNLLDFFFPGDILKIQELIPIGTRGFSRAGNRWERLDQAWRETANWLRGREHPKCK